MDISAPQIFTNAKELPAGTRIIEAYDSAVAELFFIGHPKLKKNMPEAQAPLQEFIAAKSIAEVWVLYPWLNAAAHTVDETNYFKLRTARNRLAITDAEQVAYRGLLVGIAGLSVGSSVVSSLTISGGPQRLKIADFDNVEISNLNRIRAGLPDVGANKIEICARGVWELDPFAELELWPQGIGKDSVSEFLTKPRLDIFVDEMDSIDVKILSRLICREHGIPVLMATDNGDSVILDIERFDLEPQREIFHGLIGAMTVEQAESLDYRSWLQLATRIVGPEFLTERMQDSVLAIGSELAGVPQLGTTAAIAGAAISFAIRRIASGEEMPSGRYTIGCEEKLIPGYGDETNVEQRRKKTGDFLAHFKK